METQVIKSKLEELPEDLKREVYDFVEFLLQKYGATRVKKGKIKFDWEGGLSNLKNNPEEVK